MRLVSKGFAEESRFSILVHGGAGKVRGSHKEHRDGCARAANAGKEVLEKGGSALDAVECAVRSLEDTPCFNAGTGGVLNVDGNLQLDASIMSDDYRAGGVCALPPFLHPISIARAVLEKGDHVLFASEGAKRFAIENGFTPSTLEAMRTEESRRLYEEGTLRGGTVGAVAIDQHGRFAAATSTGGKNRKGVGRVGDSPIPGAGNYATRSGATSATGDGEAFLKLCATSRVLERVRTGSSLEFALRETMRELIDETGSDGGGLILVGKNGHAAWVRSTEEMSWALARAGVETLSGTD